MVHSTIVSGVVHEIRSATERGVTLTCLQPTFGSEDADDGPGVSLSDGHGDVKRGHEHVSGTERSKTSSRSRSASPGKRKSVAQDGYDDGDGLSVLLRACEILGDSSNDTRQDCVYSVARDAGSSPRKQVKSPARSPRKASRNASPTRIGRNEKPHGPCTNQYCLNPNESPQWRRGPPEAPILCNACGTRWLRSKQLIPIMVRRFLHVYMHEKKSLYYYILHMQPQRGIRYGKSGGKSPKKAPASPVKEGPILHVESQTDAKSGTKGSDGNQNSVVKIVASI